MLSKQGELLKKEKEQLADALSDISHQLKTPLTSMTVMTDLLSNDNLTKEKELNLLKILKRSWSGWNGFNFFTETL